MRGSSLPDDVTTGSNKHSVYHTQAPNSPPDLGYRLDMPNNIRGSYPHSTRKSVGAWVLGEAAAAKDTVFLNFSRGGTMLG